ncbi:MAG: hypothetical protein ABFD82_07965 [Syntrophaceae bacterium]
MKHNRVKNEELKDLKTNCNNCALMKRKHCPYLEEVANCHMFTDLKGQRIVTEPEYKLVSQG